MAYDTPVPPPRKPGFLGVFSPDRNATPVIVAAIGTVLLTTANAQPLAPRTSNPLDQVLVYGHQSLMSEAWQAVIVAVLVAASMLAVFRSWRHITVPAGLLVAVVGIGAVIANLIILNPALSVLDIMTTRIYWPAYAAEFVLPFFAAAATVLLAGRGARNSRLASGILLATGAFGYLNYLQLLDVFLTVRLAGAPGPGRAAFIGMLGSGVLLIGGVMARAENRAPRGGQAAAQPDPGAPAPRPGSVLFARLAAAAAVIAIAVSACYAYAFTSWPSGPVSVLLSVISSFLVYAAGPVVLAVAASLTVLGRRRLDRHFAAGVLVTGGVLTIMYFGYSNVFGWLIPLRGYDGWLLDSADIGVAGGLAMAVAGIALLLGRERGRLPDAPAADPQAAPSQDHEQDHQQDHDQGPRRWPAQPEMTRYLCTAPHLDDRYARRVVDEVVVDAHRAVVPSLGIDMAVVLAHCFAARRRQNIRDGLIAAIVIAALPVIFDYHRLTGLRIIVVLLALAGLVALAERWVSRHRVTAQLTRETFDRDDRPWITAAEHAQVAEALAAEQGDISVYGTYSPFVGSGVARGGWSFAINLARGKEPPGGQVRLEPLSFEVDEFYQEIARDMAAIGLADLTIENRLLVDGQHIRDDRRFLPDREGRPVAGLSADRLAQLTREPELHNRAYQCIRLQTWEGDLVLSVFVNFTKRGTALLAEVQHFLLAPLPPEYRQADRLASWPLGKRLRTELGSVPTAITGTVIRAPFRVSRLLLRAGLGWRARRAALRQIRTDPEYNFGAMTSVRELAQARHYRRYFQQVDRDLSTKLIDRQVLDTIVDFLDAHNVDTSQFQEQRSMILNNGLLVSGGEFTAGSVAVGEQARAGVTQFAQGVQSLLRQGGESQ